MIESRYTIEYISPESNKDSKGRKPIALIIFIFLILAIALLAYFYISSNTVNDFIRSPKEPSQQKLLTTVKVNPQEELVPAPAPILLNNETTKPASNSVNKSIPRKNSEVTDKTSEKSILNKDIDKLTKQLMAERERTKDLDKQLNLQKNQNNELSELLENALSKASNADKNYLEALSSLEKQTLAKEPKIAKKTEVQEDVISKIKATKQVTPKAIKSQGNNSIRLSTTSQIDAIIAAMQGNKTTKPAPNVIKDDVDKSNERQLVSVNSSNSTELLHIQLQRQINQLIENNNTTPIIKNENYTKALEKESTVRKNAVRSITIKKGETLWEIAQRAYGNGSSYKKIIKANPQIDLDKLYIGQIIRVPN